MSTSELPWSTDGTGKEFTLPGFLNIEDLHGDISDPQLVAFFHGNQFMVTDRLIERFKKRYPQYQRIYWETLPPGVLIGQIKHEKLVIGNLSITLKPDIFTAGAKKIEALNRDFDWFDRIVGYAGNRLVLMIYRGNPKRILSLPDLGRSDVNVSMPDSKLEGIGGLVRESLKKAGGRALLDSVLVEKVEAGKTFITQMHHRQTPDRIIRGQSDVGPVWFTEALFQKNRGAPVDFIEIEKKFNTIAGLAAARMRNPPHPRAASDFLDFLEKEGRELYREYGFLPV